MEESRFTVALIIKDYKESGKVNEKQEIFPYRQAVGDLR